jgi:SAM-dependent methyltransferase
MRRVALAVLEHTLAGRSGLRLLDAGCGTGGTTIELRRFGDVVGIDLAWAALRPAATLGLAGRLARASIEQLPFANATFDAVTSFEVVYHLGVSNDAGAFAEMRRVLRPAGVLLLRVPAHDWLRGAHDRLVHTRHRYTPTEVSTKLEAAGFRIEHLSWANSVLFPPAVAKRLLLERSTGHSADGDGEPDLWQPPGPLNALLENAVAVEALAIPRRVPLPFGLSVLAVARAA